MVSWRGASHFSRRAAAPRQEPALQNSFPLSTIATEHAARPLPRPAVGPLLALTFALTACAALLSWRDVPHMGTLAVTFVSIVLEALPFVALGALIGGLIEAFVPRERLTAWIPRGRLWPVLLAASLGIVAPVCECAVIPVTRRLVGKGLPFSVAVAYLLAGPIVNPIVAASTAVAYAGDWLMVVARLGCGYGIAVVVALVIDRVFPGHAALRPAARAALEATDCACHGEHADHGHMHRTTDPAWSRGSRIAVGLFRASQFAADDFLNVGQFLVLGAFAAALSQTFVPRASFLALAETPLAAILVMMALAVALNLCSEADAFVAASFRYSLPLSAQLAFMVLGPMLDLKLLAMYLSFVRKRALSLMVGLMVLLLIGTLLVLNQLGWEDTA